MKSKYILCFFCIFFSCRMEAKLYRLGEKSRIVKPFVKSYIDSLEISENRIDTVLFAKRFKKTSEVEALLYLPLTFYHSPVSTLFSMDSDAVTDDCLKEYAWKTLLNIYLSRPDLVENTENKLEKVGPVIQPRTTKINSTRELIEKVAPQPEEIAEIPIDIMVEKPNFWTVSGDSYLQFLQNYVSSNWYKGGESNYSMVGSVSFQANYNNKKKLKWDNKLELKLGYQTTKGDTLHKYKTSEDLIRYTGKLGLQASKKWYYTMQLIAYTQFTKGYKTNDPMLYSNFMTPFNGNLSLGMDYNVSWFRKKMLGSFHLAPFALNYRYVRDLNLSPRYGLALGRHSKFDYGSEFTVDLTWNLSEMIRWKMRMYGFSTYNRTEFEWENTLTFKFNQYISTNVFIYPRFDDGAHKDERKGFWQLKEYASIGFSYLF